LKKVRGIFVNKQSGFSLLEVMVVLVIIGMIMSIVAPNIMGQQEEAAIDKAHLDIQQIEDALSLYKLKNKAYPTTEQGLEALVTKPSGDPTPKNWRQYLNKTPMDPWENPYKYLSPGSHGDFDIYSFGPDGVQGDDDIGNWTVDK